MLEACVPKIRVD